MSLTVLINSKLPSVGIVRWFLDPKVSISYATGPLTEMSLDEFRSVGWDWVRRHFEEYKRVRLPEEQATAVFDPGEERRFLKDCYAIRIRMEDSGDLTLIPQTFSKYTLAGLESLGQETRRTVSSDSPAEVFWKAFDEVLPIACDT